MSNNQHSVKVTVICMNVWKLNTGYHHGEFERYCEPVAATENTIMVSLKDIVN